MVEIKLETNNTEYQSTGETVLEAIKNLPLHWLEIKTKGMVKLRQGEQKTERLMTMKQLRVMMSSKLRQMGFAKQLTEALEYSA